MRMLSSVAVVVSLVSSTSARGQATTPTPPARPAPNGTAQTAVPTGSALPFGLAATPTSGAFTLVLMRAFPARPGDRQHDAIVLRHPGENGAVVIALRRAAASPALLARALSSAVWLQAKRRIDFKRAMYLYIPSGVPLPIPDPVTTTRMASLLAQAEAAPEKEVLGAGRVPAIAVSASQIP